MSDDWGSLFRKGWETTNNPRATLDEMNYAVSCLAAALVTSPPHFPFVALMQLVRIHCSLADRDSAACSYHAETAVTLAQHALALSKENYPGGRAPKLQLLIKDALGSAHLRRYRSKGSKQDCLRAIGLHRACLMSESPDFPSRIVKASWHHHLSVALIEYVRDFWTTNLLPEMLAAFGAGYAALRLSRWSNPHYWTTLCGFRVFIMLETKHHSISWAERGRTTSDIIMSFLHDVVWVLHRRATELAHVWLDRASRQNPEPNIATAIKLIGLVLLLLSINKGDTDAFDKCARQVQHLLSEEQSEFDLRHSPYLLDLLGALVRCRRLGLHHEGLIGKIGVQLDTLLPGRAEAAGDNTEVEVDPPRHHPERPRLYYLRGEAIYYDISAQKMSGHRNLKYKYAIAHLRAALTMVPDGHPRQLQYLLSLAFALAGSSQSTGAANNEADEHLHEFYSWMQLIAALEMEEGHPQRDISRGDEFEKLVPLLFSLALDGQDVVVKFGLNYMGYRHGLATVHSEQHIETGIAFASLSVRQCLTDVKNIGYTKDTRRLVEQGLEIWKNLHRDYPGNSSITFGYGAALSVQADHEQFQGDDLNLAYDIYGEGIKLMHLSWETSNSSPLVDVENRLFLAETYLKRQGVYVVLTGGEMDESDIDQALRQLQISAARSESAGLPAAVTYSVAKTWTKHALDLNRNHRLVSKACSAHARALSQLSWVGLALDDRLKAMKDADQVLAARAAIWAIQEEQYELALELSEASHTVLFSSVASTLKAPKMIETSYPELWLQYTSLGKKIANTASFREESSKTDPGHLNKLDDAQELGDLGIEFDQCISKIRKIPGQENFLKPVSFSEHEAAAKNRLIASLITSQDYEYCYALLLLGKAPQAIRLSLRPSETETLVGQYKRALSHGSRRVHPNDDCGGYRQMDRYKDQHINPTAIATEVLKKLWYLVMKPIIDFIEKNVVKQVSNLTYGFLSILKYFRPPRRITSFNSG